MYLRLYARLARGGDATVTITVLVSTMISVLAPTGLVSPSGVGDGVEMDDD